MYDQQSSPMPISKIIKSRLKKHFFDMARLIHQPFQQPTNVKMAWLNSDDPLSISVMKRTSKISKLGESLEIEAIDEFEGNLAKASRRHNLSGSCQQNPSKTNAPSQTSAKGETSSSIWRKEDAVNKFDGEDGENGNLEADEISLELKLYDQGPVYLTDLSSNPPIFRSRTRRSIRCRPSSRLSSNDLDDPDYSPSNIDADDGVECDQSDMIDDEDNNDFHHSDTEDCPERCKTPLNQEPQYEMVAPIWCMMEPGQRLSTIYVKPADACVDLTNAFPEIYRDH